MSSTSGRRSLSRCTSAADVRSALVHAREHDLAVAVRGGGHSMSGHSSCDGGLVIDTGPMKLVSIDAEVPNAAGSARADLGRARRRHPGARPGGDRWARLPHGRRRTDPRQRLRLAGAGLRVDLREPALRAGGDRGRSRAARRRRREPRSVLGAQGRRRQLRRRHRVRAPAASGRPDRVCRDDPAPARRRYRPAALLPGVHGDGPRPGLRRIRAARPPTRRRHSRASARTARRGSHRAVCRRAG